MAVERPAVLILPAWGPLSDGWAPFFSMIDSTFLADLRRRHYAPQLLLLVQLEQVTPGFWLTQAELAEQMGITPETLRKSMAWLRDRDLLRFTCTMRGTWVWWVARKQDDRPDSSQEPCWVFRNTIRRKVERVPLSQVEAWTERHRIHKETMKHWLMGMNRVLAGRWELVATPMDPFMPAACEDV